MLFQSFCILKKNTIVMVRLAKIQLLFLSNAYLQVMDIKYKTQFGIIKSSCLPNKTKVSIFFIHKVSHSQ